jgi:carboxymethylenebutenolidase
MAFVAAPSQPPGPIAADWLDLPPEAGQPRLRCWWARPQGSGPWRGAVLVLPEVFGLNGWVRSLAERLAAEGYGALALPLFARTAPDLELGYDAAGLAAGREHRDAVRAETCLADARRAIAWLQQQEQRQGGMPGRPVGCVGFCFGGHLALLVATLPGVGVTCSFYGARVSSFRPGGGAPTLAVLPQISGDLLCFCGDQDPLMPPEELDAIRTALADSGSGRRRELLVATGAGHGYMCEARADFEPQAAAQGWHAMVAAFATGLADPA